MGGPRVTAVTEKFLIQVWRILKTESNKAPNAKQVLAKAEALIEKHPTKGIYLPKLRKVQMILAKAVENQGNLPEEQRQLDEPWSMKTLDEFPLSADSLPYVLQAWRYTVSLGKKFSIRQAKWCSRLYALFKEKDISRLWFASRMYVHNEETYNLFSRYEQYPPDYEMDSALVMEHWERETFQITEFVLHLSEGGISMLPAFPCANDGEIAEEFIYALPQIEHTLHDKPKEVFERVEKINYLIKQLPSSRLFFPDIESRMVYLRHLSYLKKMPKWDTLSPEELKDIIIGLREWIIAQIPIKDTIDINESFPREIYLRAGWQVKGGKQ